MVHRAEEDAQARRAARLRYEHRLDTGEIAMRLKLPQRKVRDLIARAEKGHLVDIWVDYVFNAPPVADDDLGRELAKVAKLQAAFVLKSEDGGVIEDPDRPQAIDDQLHYRLGYLAAPYIRQILRSDDSIAVGAGRGVAYTVRALRELVQAAPMELPELEVFSLVGSMWVRIESMGRAARDYYIDSDQSALELASMFDVPWPQLHLVWLPRVYSAGDDDEYEEVVKRVAPHLRGDDWSGDTRKKTARIGVSLFGLGVCNLEHYWLRHGGMQVSAVPEMQRLEQLLGEHPDAVIDICDRVLLRENVLPEDLREEASAIVNGLSDRSLAVSFQKLNSASVRCLVSGGRDKVDAMLEVLSNGRRIGIQPNVLVTDESSARELIERLPTLDQIAK